MLVIRIVQYGILLLYSLWRKFINFPLYLHDAAISPNLASTCMSATLKRNHLQKTSIADACWAEHREVAGPLSEQHPLTFCHAAVVWVIILYWQIP